MNNDKKICKICHYYDNIGYCHCKEICLNNSQFIEESKTIEEIQDEIIGKKGTPIRDRYEREIHQALLGRYKKQIKRALFLRKIRKLKSKLRSILKLIYKP